MKITIRKATVPLVRVNGLLATDCRYYKQGWKPDADIWVRPEVLRALQRAEGYLPPGYKILIWDGLRSRDTQLAMIASLEADLRRKYPGIGKRALHKRIRELTSLPKKIVYRLDSHRTGGAVDVTIIDDHGRPLDMGTDHDDVTAEAGLYYYTWKKKLNPREQMIKKNRSMLLRVMRKAGFGVYGPEWWHFDFTKDEKEIFANGTKRRRSYF